MSGLSFTRFLHAIVVVLTLTLSTPARAVTLWSDERIEGGPGLFFGPGNIEPAAILFPTVIRNMIFTTDVDFFTPFANRGRNEPRTLGEVELGLSEGKISDGGMINRNAGTGTFTVGGTRLYPVVVRSSDGRFGGSQVSVTALDGQVTMTMDITIDLGIGPRGIIRLPFYGTTGTVVVPHSLQTQGGAHGVDRAGQIPSGSKVAGRIGDFDGDGYIDGTLVAAGVMPLTSPIFAGQPYLLIRNFITDLRIEGGLFGKVDNKAEQLMPQRR